MRIHSLCLKVFFLHDGEQAAVPAYTLHGKLEGHPKGILDRIASKGIRGILREPTASIYEYGILRDTVLLRAHWWCKASH